MFDISIKEAGEVTKRLRRFAAAQPSNPLANYYYAMSLWKGRRGQAANPVNSEEIAGLLHRAVSLDPKFPDAHFELGVLCAERGDYDDAIRQFQEAIGLKPDYAEAHYHLAQAFSHVGKKDLATREFDIYRRAHQKEMVEDKIRRERIGQLVYSLQGPPTAP
jgi:tetratricopeptide (TPR) repeat protein